MSIYRNISLAGYHPTEQRWIVPKVFRARSLALLSAAPGSLKTWSALDLARAAATGSAWQGHGPVSQSAVMLILRDSTDGDSASQWRRLTQEFSDGGPESRALLNDLVVQYTGDVLLAPRDETPEAQAEVRSSCDQIIEAANNFDHKTRTWAGGKPEEDESFEEMIDGEPTGRYLVRNVLGNTFDPEAGDFVTNIETPLDPAYRGVQVIIIDSLSTVHYAPESDSSSMAKVMRNLRRIADETGALVLVLHHNRKTSTDPRFQAVRWTWCAARR